MQKLAYLLIVILVVGGFGILGYLVGESFKESIKQKEIKEKIQDMPANTIHNKIILSN
jgi:hypothetical protein